jgi:hypothetical protein
LQDLTPYLAGLVGRLRAGLGGELVAVVLTGSGALGDYEPRRSDVDVIAVCEAPLAPERARELAARVSHRELPCPARRLELVVAARGDARAFTLMVETGEGHERVALDPAGEPAFWFLIDRAIAHDRGRALYGPPPAQVLAAPPRADVVAALHDSLDWHRAHEPASENAVLNACRGWRWARTGRWTSKRKAGEWALSRMSDPAVVERALARRPLQPQAVSGFLEAMHAAIR